MSDRKFDLARFHLDQLIPLDIKNPLQSLRQNVRESQYERPHEEVLELPPLDHAVSLNTVVETKFSQARALEATPYEGAIEPERFRDWFATFEVSFWDALEDCAKEPDRLKQEWQRIQATRAHTDLLVTALHNELKPLPSAVLLEEFFLTIFRSQAYIQLRASERVEAAMVGLIRRAMSLGIRLVDASTIAFESSTTDRTDDEDTDWGEGENRTPRPPTLV